MTTLVAAAGPLVGFARVEPDAGDELRARDVELEDGVVAGGGEEEAVALEEYLVAVAQVVVLVRAEDVEGAVEDEELVGGGDVDVLPVEGDAAEPAPRRRGRPSRCRCIVPIEDLLEGGGGEVDG
ncbi:MAG: hypothetical protein R3B49_03995 [Phycisphaerales bacterium]